MVPAFESQCRATRSLPAPFGCSPSNSSSRREIRSGSALTPFDLLREAMLEVGALLGRDWPVRGASRFGVKAHAQHVDGWLGGGLGGNAREERGNCAVRQHEVPMPIDGERRIRFSVRPQKGVDGAARSLLAPAHRVRAQERPARSRRRRACEHFPLPAKGPREPSRSSAPSHNSVARARIRGSQVPGGHARLERERQLRSCLRSRQSRSSSLTGCLGLASRKA